MYGVGRVCAHVKIYRMFSDCVMDMWLEAAWNGLKASLEENIIHVCFKKIILLKYSVNFV